jgi:hypothetical protein
LPDVTSPLDLPARSLCPWRGIIRPGSVKATSLLRGPARRTASRAAWPMKSWSQETAKSRPASMGLVSVSKSWPASRSPASRRRVSRAPRPAGLTPSRPRAPISGPGQVDGRGCRRGLVSPESLGLDAHNLFEGGGCVRTLDRQHCRDRPQILHRHRWKSRAEPLHDCDMGRGIR